MFPPLVYPQQQTTENAFSTVTWTDNKTRALFLRFHWHGDKFKFFKVIMKYRDSVNLNSKCNWNKNLPRKYSSSVILQGT